MPNLHQSLDTSQTRRGEDVEIRSPRTPTYVPNSTSFITIPPFDPSRLSVPFAPPHSIEQLPPPPPPPPPPLTWLWQCHLCRSRYPLGTTRRCLVDGHFYCSGETDRPRLKRKKKGESCSSEFDYVGWRSMELWKRKLRKSQRFSLVREPEGCETCEFPSQCRYAHHHLPARDTSSSGVTDIDRDKACTTLSESGLDRLSRFYETQNIAFESQPAGSGENANESRQSKVIDLEKRDRKVQAHSDNDSTFPTFKKNTKSTERHSGLQSILSPILEEVLIVDMDPQDTQDTEDTTE